MEFDDDDEEEEVGELIPMPHSSSSAFELGLTVGDLVFFRLARPELAMDEARGCRSITPQPDFSRPSPPPCVCGRDLKVLGLCLREGRGMVWNLSANGWGLSGDVPLRVGQTCPLTVKLPNQQRLFLAAVTVRWVRGQEYGVETLVIDDVSREDMEQCICQRVEDKLMAFHARRTVLPRKHDGDRDC